MFLLVMKTRRSYEKKHIIAFGDLHGSPEFLMKGWVIVRARFAPPKSLKMGGGVLLGIYNIGHVAGFRPPT